MGPISLERNEIFSLLDFQRSKGRQPIESGFRQFMSKSPIH